MADPAGRGTTVGVRVCAVLAVLAGVLIAAPAANAAFSLTNLSAKPANNDAGANSRFSVSFQVQEPSAQMKRLVLHLPPGLVGNPLATPTCTEQRLNANNCPAASDVGDISNTVNVLGLPLPVTASGNVYNVVPRNGEPARFGFVLTTPGGVLPPIILQSPASLRQSDFGLDTTLDNIPKSVNGLRIDITGVSLSLQGKVGSPAKGFMRNPTSCGNHTVAYDAAAYDGQTASGSTTFGTDNCGALPFHPKFSAKVHQLTNDLANPVELTTTISQTIAEAGLEKAVVTLPTDIIGNGPALAIQCETAAFDAGNCPADTMVGEATAASPLQAKPLAGKVYLVKPTGAGPFPDLGVDLKGGLALKVKGSISAQAVPTGLQIFVTFDGLPDIPLSDFSLTFAGGDGGLNVAGRDPCKPPPFVFEADFLGHSGATSQVSADADATCPSGGGGKKPKARVTIGKVGSGKPKVALRLRAGSAQLDKARLKLPRGLAVGPKRKLLAGSEVSGATVRGKRRTLRLKAKGGGVDRIRAVFTGGAIRARKGLKESKLKRFPITIRDAAGERTKLSVSAK
jgi:hypothetical protein